MLLSGLKVEYEEKCNYSVQVEAFTAETVRK